jgi:transcription elongation factor GreB
MSKAFTKESDEGLFDEVIPEPKDLLPEGLKNYVTPQGAEALRGELRHLEEEIRPDVARAKRQVEVRSRLEAIDRRAHFLREHIANMVVVDPANQERGSVRFGARVRVADKEGNEKVYQVVGVDESEPAHGKISWISPIAKALISARVGDVVTLELPDGDVELEILSIQYG